MEQDPSDEPATELLGRIQAEKTRLIEDGRERTAKPVLGYRGDAIPFSLPASWQWSQLATVGFISPRNDAADDLMASFVPMPMISAQYGVANQHEIRLWGEIKTGYTHFAEGDVGLAKITPCFENGKSTVFRRLTGGIGAGTTELHIVRPVIVSADYLLIFLKCPHFVNSGIPVMTGTAGQKRVPVDYFSRTPLPIPPLAEQHRIVAKVDELMALCDRLEAAQNQREQRRDQLVVASLRQSQDEEGPTPRCQDAEQEKEPDEKDLGALAPWRGSVFLQHIPRLTTRPEHIKALRQIILNLAVRGKLVGQHPEDGPASELLMQVAAEKSRRVQAGKIRPEKPLPPLSEVEKSCELPSGWAWVRLGALVLDSDSGWSPRTENHAREGDAWGVLKVSAVSWDRFDPSANKQLLPGMAPRLQAQVHKGDFLISRANTAELIARAVLVEDEPRNLMMSDKIVRLCLFDRCDHRYVWLVNNHADFARAYYARNATGVSPSMKNVSRNVILDLPLPLPPLAEQHRIVVKVDELMAVCDQLEANLTATQTDSRRLLEAVLHEALVPARRDAA